MCTFAWYILNMVTRECDFRARNGLRSNYKSIY